MEPAYGGSRVLDYFDELADDGDGARIGLGELGEISEELGAFGCRGDDRGVAPVLFCHGSVLARARFKRPLESRQVVARHERSFEEGALVLDPRHVLPLLEHKSRAVSEATALMQGQLPPVFHTLREALRPPPTRRPDREWVQIRRLLEDHPEAAVEAAVAEALERGSPRLETVRLLLRRRDESDANPLRLSRLRNNLSWQATKRGDKIAAQNQAMGRAEAWVWRAEAWVWAEAATRE